jgi:hypothetical protein
MNQAFGKGDIAMCGKFKVKIVECIQDEDGSWWYEIEPVEFNSFTREVPQSKLKRL